jgi:hypothetical protein
MTSRFENLFNLLNYNPELRDMFLQKFQEKNEYLSILDNLVSFFIHSHRDMLIVKIKETNSLKKFNSLISELNTAKIFVQKGCSINFLSDDYFENASPDILCRCSDFSFYVEVTQLSDSEPTLKIIEELRELLRDRPFVARIEFTDFLSQPCFSGAERREQDKILENSMAQFRKDLKSLSPESQDHEIITEGIKFSLTYTGKRPGIVGSFSSSYMFPEDLFEKYATYRLLEKAEKRESFKGSEKNYPYILAFASEIISIDEIDFKDLLYGCTTEIFAIQSNDPEEVLQSTILRDNDWQKIIGEKSKHIPRWQEIEAAANSGWNDFLTRIHYIPINFIYLTKEGLFLSEPLMKNVSGILLIRKSTEYHFYLNPFCEQVISLVNHQQYFNSFN